LLLLLLLAELVALLAATRAGELRRRSAALSFGLSLGNGDAEADVDD
jgi:hypothetical protein